MNIAFIGLGHFGRAIASLVEYNGLEYDYAEVNKLLDKPADLVFLMTPTQFMRQALVDNKKYLSDQTIIVNGAKGIEEKTHLMAHQIVRSVSRFPNYYSLIGPSFADEVLNQHPTVVSLGYKREEHVDTIRKVLETPYFRVQPSKGYRALELASALKNLYAISCGYAQGLGFGSNTRSQLITIALNEFKQLAKAMHFADYDVMAPGVVGDLVLTCSSEQSRNFAFGLELSKSEGKSKPQHTVEGYHTSHSIKAIAKNHNVNLPLAFLTYEIINGSEPTTADDFRNFLANY